MIDGPGDSKGEGDAKHAAHRIGSRPSAEIEGMYRENRPLSLALRVSCGLDARNASEPGRTAESQERIWAGEEEATQRW